MSTVNAGWRGPNIVKEGLVLYLDAASGTSYSPYTSGNTWRDISGNGNNAFFTNGASYSTSNGGVVALDGANDFVALNSFAIPNNNGQLSINMWINIPASPGSNLATLYGDGSQTNNIGYLWSYILVHDITYQYATNSVGRQNIVLSNYMLNSYNMWVNYCIVIDYTALTFAAYKNGVSFSTGGLSAAASFPTADRTRYIGTYTGGGGLFLLSGLVGPFMMYTKTLSAQEVQQNYNSVKSRFGL